MPSVPSMPYGLWFIVYLFWFMFYVLCCFIAYCFLFVGFFSFFVCWFTVDGKHWWVFVHNWESSVEQHCNFGIHNHGV
jgi:hypothetical protein